jgi:hypothetical protein
MRRKEDETNARFLSGCLMIRNGGSLFLGFTYGVTGEFLLKIMEEGQIWGSLQGFKVSKSDTILATGVFFFWLEHLPQVGVLRLESVSPAFCLLAYHRIDLHWAYIHIKEGRWRYTLQSSSRSYRL